MNARSNALRVRYLTDEERWRAVCARDVRADEHFVYAVRSTGVFCRPSASARLPSRANVEFFDSAEAAIAAGYRASRRAKGDRTSAAAARAEVVASCCRWIEASETMPSLVELSARAQMSPSHFHRLFTAEMGLTPRAYGLAARAKRFREELRSSDGTVTDAIYEAGFGSSSRFYEASGKVLGMKAREYKAGARGMTIRFAVGQCSLGAILVAQSERGVCAISLGDEPEPLVRELQDEFPRAELVGGDAAFERLVAEVVGFIEAPAMGLNLPLDVRGTAFQERVWQALREIPSGTTMNYTELAEKIGAPAAVRAVARACATNRLAVAIPCHRVVRRDGDLAGYRWGIERKSALLTREAKR